MALGMKLIDERKSRSIYFENRKKKKNMCDYFNDILYISYTFDQHLLINSNCNVNSG